MAYLEVEGMKRRRKKIMLIIPAAVICVAGAGTVGYFKVAHTKPVQNVTAQAQSAEAKKGNLSKTIVGTGNLELAEAEDQDAPSGLEISEVMVESGDEVKEGMLLRLWMRVRSLRRWSRCRMRFPSWMRAFRNTRTVTRRM